MRINYPGLLSSQYTAMSKVKLSFYVDFSVFTGDAALPWKIVGDAVP